LLSYFISVGNTPHLVMSVLLVFYAIILIRLGLRIRNIQTRAIKVEIENEEMFDLLKSASDETASTRQRLDDKISHLAGDVAERDNFFKYTPDCQCILGPDATIRQLNPALKHLLGLDDEEAPSGSWYRFIARQETGKVHALLERANSGVRDARGDVSLITTGGATCPLSWRVSWQDGLYYCTGRRETTDSAAVRPNDAP
ncbi:MAG: hypothetical protein P8126_05630, partial [Gammaproteobacteria bacterium]